MTALKITAGQRTQGIKGITSILHNIRSRLGITCDEYTIIDAIYRLRLEGTAVNVFNLFQLTGFTEEQIRLFVDSLIAKEFLERQEKKLFTAKKWNDQFFAEDDFEEFWEIYKGNGSKKKSKGFYKQARLQVEKGFLHQRAKEYIASEKEFQYVMRAERYLNPKNAYWETDFRKLKASKNNVEEGIYTGRMGGS